jgi:RimJ/RimL family protein N-acetyltransferase
MTHVDLDEMALLLGSPDPVRPTRRLRTRVDAEQWIEWNLRNYADYGHGLWVIEAHEGLFVGDCGLTVQDIEGEPHIEVGYHVHLALRGQGFATEAAAQVRETARAAGAEHLVAIIRPENTPSQLVAQHNARFTRTVGPPWCSALHLNDSRERTSSADPMRSRR